MIKDFLKEENDDNSSNHSSKNISDMTSIIYKSDVDNTIENENIEKKVNKISQIISKSKNVNYSNSIEFKETKKDLSKSPILNEKEKNIFPIIINNLLKYFQNNSMI